MLLIFFFGPMFYFSLATALNLIFGCVKAQKPISYGQENILVWLKMPLLVPRNTAGDATTSPFFFSGFVEEKTVEMFWLPSKISCFDCHRNSPEVTAEHRPTVLTGLKFLDVSDVLDEERRQSQGSWKVDKGEGKDMNKNSE